MPSRTHCLLCLPIELETPDSKALFSLALPLVVRSRWSNQINSIAELACHELFGLGVVRIRQMLLGKELFVFSCLMNDGSHIHISLACKTRFDMGNQPRLVLITAFCQMHFVPDPPGRQFASIRRFRIIG